VDSFEKTSRPSKKTSNCDFEPGVAFADESVLSSISAARLAARRS
jgi:hypothetical protein